MPVCIEKVVARFGGRVEENTLAASAAVVSATGFKVRRIAERGESLFDFALPAARAAISGRTDVKGVIAATFSNEMRFPSLAVRIASALGLPKTAAAFDLQMACSAYPYAVYLAGLMAAQTSGSILVVDADIQSRFLEGADAATAVVMDDAATASIVTADASENPPPFSFLSTHSEALSCPADGPIAMDGFKVFSFVARDVAEFLRPFGDAFDMFVPHRANLYMVRQLAKSLGLADKLLVADAPFANPGSCSIAATLALCARPGNALIAGFGAGLSACAGIVSLPAHFQGSLIP